MLDAPKELPELRSRLEDWAGGSDAPILFAPHIQKFEPDLSDQAVHEAARNFAALDASSFRDAELLHVAPTMVELLMQARSGIGDAGFMDFDLPAPVGMAYFAVELDAVRNPSANLPSEVADFNARAADTGVDPIELDERMSQFVQLALPEHLLCVWRVMPPESPEHPHGYVHLSWWFEREAWWQNYQKLGEILGDKSSPPAHVPRGLPAFVPDGHQTIGFHPDSAGVRVDFTGGDRRQRERRPDMFRALCYLLRQRIAETETVAADRAARRRAAREGRALPTVRVISLRGASASGGGDGGREYAHRWMVRGHWRRQWYPSIQQNRPIWITPYIKGPDDAPLIGGEKVYMARA